FLWLSYLPTTVAWSIGFCRGWLRWSRSRRCCRWRRCAVCTGSVRCRRRRCREHRERHRLGGQRLRQNARDQLVHSICLIGIAELIPGGQALLPNWFLRSKLRVGACKRHSTRVAIDHAFDDLVNVCKRELAFGSF